MENIIKNHKEEPDSTAKTAGNDRRQQLFLGSLDKKINMLSILYNRMENKTYLFF